MTFLSDFIKLLKEAGSSLNEALDLPRKERDKYRQHFQDAYILLTTTLGMVITKLGDALNEERNDEFYFKARNLDNFQDWFDAERKIGLCNGLRVFNREMNTIRGSIMGKISVKNWSKLKDIMDQIFQNETDLAKYISKKLKSIADNARKKTVKSILIKQIAGFRNQLREERNQLLAQEKEMLDNV
jgi:hypothetical protein